MSLFRITLRLARNDDFPSGASDIGYIIHAPLDGHGKLELAAWQANRKACTVQRFHPDPNERADGWLSHRGAQWYIRYDEDFEGPDEDAHRLGEHVFAHGEYVTIDHHGEEPLTYVVTEVSPTR